MSIARDIGSAVRLLSVLPLGRVEGARPVPWFGWVGWMYAALGAGIVWASSLLGHATGTGALLTAALVVSSWGLLSGFLHWDGLADSADGVGVRGDAARKLAVMKDSTIGAFGVCAIVFVAILQVTALAVAIDAGSWWVLAAPIFGRLAATFALWLRTPASDTGLAARYAGHARPAEVVVALMAVLLTLAVPFPPVAGRALVLVAGITFAALVPGVFARRLGGVNGDVLGAAIVLTETFVLVLCAFAGGVV